MTTQILAPQTSQTFLDAVDLVPVDGPTGTDLKSFEAIPQYAPWPKAYGGDMVAQATAAMIATMVDEKVIHSTHSTFMRPVNMLEPVRYDVEILRDGRNFATRHVRGIQNGKTAFISTGSFQAPTFGAEYSMPAGDDLHVDPNSLASAAEVLEGVETDAARYWANGRSFDMRHIPGPIYLEHNSDGKAQESSSHQGVWVRAFTSLTTGEPVHEAANLHRIGLTYVCDYTILEPLLRTQGLTWSSPGLVTASLDHAMWFHRQAPMDDWILYSQDAESMQSGRGLSLGRFFTRQGELIATVAQEGMIAPGTDA